MFGFTIAPFCPKIFNFILRTNLSYSPNVLIVEYFINQEKYFYVIMLHSLVAVFLAMTIITAIGLLFYSYFQFICGVFQIASYRIERAMSVHVLQNINLRKNIFICKSLICAVHTHRQAMKFCLLWESNCTVMVFFLIIFGTLTMSFNMFRMMSSGNDIKEFLISFIHTFFILVYAFLSNYSAQLVTDLNHQLFVTAYKIPWYRAPISIQKLILFLLQKTSKTFYVTCGGVYVGSIEGFAMIIKTSVSYFTLMHSVQ
ncbi:uncharacterized protein LOC114932367 [Nylanderia fulva]|nr:uncharacterized protein LOC114932367 [Nylanderia fulva]